MVLLVEVDSLVVNFHLLFRLEELAAELTLVLCMVVKVDATDVPVNKAGLPSKTLSGWYFSPRWTILL